MITDEVLAREPYFRCRFEATLRKYAPTRRPPSRPVAPPGEGVRCRVRVGALVIRKGEAALARETHGCSERAVEFLTAMQTVDGDNATALDMLVRITQDEGKLADAQRWRERILHIRPPRRIEDLSIWVKHHVDAGNFEIVLEHLHKEELEAPTLSVLNLMKAMVFLTSSPLFKSRMRCSSPSAKASLSRGVASNASSLK